MGVYCDACEEVVPGGLEDFKAHINEFQHQPPFICTEGDCQRRKFQVTTSLYRHLRDNHEDVCNSSLDSPTGSPSETPTRLVPSTGCDNLMSGRTAPDADDNVFNEIPDDEAHEDPVITDEFQQGLERAAALLILNVRKHGNVTGAAVSTIVKECQVLINNVVQLTKTEISRKLKQAGIEDDVINSCVMDSEVYEPFTKLKSCDQQISYFQQNFGFIKPQPKFIQYRFENRMDKKSRNLLPKQIRVEFQYVPIIETLTAVLNNPVLYALIHSEKRSTDGKIRSFLDASLADSHPLIKQYPNTIRITSYTDDFEPANALGAKAGTHKTAGLYFAVQNLPAEENARLRSIHVAGYGYRMDFPSDRGVDVMLEPFLQDIKKLECDAGVVVKVNGEDYTLRATLVGFAADTLSAHEILGLSSASSGHFCSLCYVHRADFHKNIFAVGVPRTKELIIAQANEIGTRGQKYVQQQYGVQRRSLLMNENLLANFPEACLLDPMHDILRGVAPMEIKLALYDFIIDKKITSVEAFNAKLQAFNYGPADIKNRPSPNFTLDAVRNKGNYTLHQSAAQTWCLLRIFPFIAASLNVPEDNEHLKMLVLLKRIGDIVFSTCHSEDDLNLLPNVITEHHQTFTDLYPAPAAKDTQATDEDDVEENEDFLVEEDVDGDLNPGGEEDISQDQSPTNSTSTEKTKKKEKPKVIRQINKHHHLLHYLYLLRKFGPIVLYWCMRFEGKHALAKRFAAICCNFNNLPVTFGTVHQINHAAELLELATPVNEDATVPAGYIKAAGETGYFNLLEEVGLKNEDVVVEVTEVTVGGYVYGVGLYVSLPLLKNNLPMFGRILSVLVHNSNVYIITEDTKCVRYDLRFGAYLIEDEVNAPIRLSEPLNLPPDRPMSLWTADSVSFYLSPRRSLAML